MADAQSGREEATAKDQPVGFDFAAFPHRNAGNLNGGIRTLMHRRRRE